MISVKGWGRTVTRPGRQGT